MQGLHVRCAACGKTVPIFFLPFSWVQPGECLACGASLAISGLVLRHNPKPFLARVFRDAMSMADRDRRDTERDRLRRRRNKERMREQRASEMGGEGWLDELLAVDAWETGVAAAVSSGATECAVALVHKAPVGAVRSGHGSDLLYRACERGQPAVADALLVLGADANATDGTGRGDTALMVASGGGTTGLDMRAMHGRYWSNLGNDLQGRPRAADQQGITGRFNAVEPKMEGTPHTGRSDAGRSNSADLEVGTKCAAELSTSSCGADDAWDGVATGAALLDDIAEGVPARRATTGFADCVKLLLTAGADPLRRDKLEWTALMHACSVRQCDYDCELCRDHTEIVAKVLLAVMLADDPTLRDGLEVMLRDIRWALAILEAQDEQFREYLREEAARTSAEGDSEGDSEGGSEVGRLIDYGGDQRRIPKDEYPCPYGEYTCMYV